MSTIKMGTFIDYMLTAGTGRLTAIKRLRSGEEESATDFYKPVSEAIVDVHTKDVGTDVDTAVLDDFLATLTDPRERRIFPKVVNGYKKFLRQGKMVWFGPPARYYPLGPLSVRVAPEVGLLIDGRPHAIKLYFRGDPISPERVVLTNALLANALSTTWPVTVMATLDVRRARLFTHHPKPEVGALLKAEAASFSSLLASL